LTKMQYNWEDKTILVVDDTKLNFLVLKNQLKKTNANVIWILNGQFAVEHVEKGKKVDLILMDIRMPVMDGIEATRKIKELNPEIPVIIQTASVMGNAFEEIPNSNCDDTIFKPINAYALIQKIAAFFENN